MPKTEYTIGKERGYDEGYEDGVQHVLDLIDSYINRIMIDGWDGEVRACENLLDDIRETLDNE